MEKVVDLLLNRALLMPIGLRLGKHRDVTFYLARKMSSVRSPVIFDIGAHIGSFSKDMLRRSPHSIIHVFEPEENNFTRLKSRLGNSRFVNLNKVAVSDRDGSSLLQLTASRLANSLLPVSELGETAFPRHLSPAGSVPVKTITIDSYCEENDVGRIDVLKIDVQGSEVAVLDGASKMISKVSEIVCELNFDAYYKGSAQFIDIVSRLEQLGFKLNMIYDLAVDRRNGRALFCDGHFSRIAG